jgi:hypothetical protein
VSHFDPKTTLSVLLTGLAILAGRSLGVDDVCAARIVSIVVFAASIGLTFSVVLKLGSWRAGAFASLIFMSFPLHAALAIIGARPKIFLIFFLLLSIQFFASRRFFFAGLFASLCFLCWQPSGIVLVAMLLACVSARKPLPIIASVLAGAILPVMLYEAYFVITGFSQVQLEQSVYFPARFLGQNRRELFESIKSVYEKWTLAVGRFDPLIVVFLYGTARFWVGHLRPSRTSVSEGHGQAWVYVHLCSLGALAFTIYDHQGLADLLFVSPFVAIVSGWIVDRFLRRVSHAVGGRGEAVGAIAVTTVLLFEIATTARPAQLRVEFTLSDQYRLAMRVSNFLNDGEQVYAIGCTHLLALNHADNWLPYGFFFPGVDDFIEAKTGSAAFTPVKDGRWPTIILLSRNPPRGAETWLHSRYIEMPAPDFAAQGIRVFRLRAESSPD